MDIINDFQKGDLKIVILQKDTAIGVTLNKSNMLIIISATYQPQVFYQAAGRIVDSNINKLNFKKVYWLLDEFDESAGEILLDKQTTLLDFGFDYTPSDQCVKKIIFESGEDEKFVKRLISPEIKFKAYNKNEYYMSSSTIKAMDKLLNNYIFIIDNDTIIEKLKLKENNIKYLTFNQLFGVEDKFKTIEDILYYLKVYDDDISELNLFQKCNVQGSLLKRIFDEYKGKKINKIILLNELLQFNSEIVKLSMENIKWIKRKIKYILKKIDEEVTVTKSVINKFNSILSYIKSVKMNSIDSEFFSNVELRKKCKENILRGFDI